MFDIFEKPWPLFFVAVLVLLVVLTVRSVFPEKRRWWQWLLPVLLAAAAFGLDRLVQTDLEKINALIKTGIKAVEEENADAINAVISENYRDSYHNTKDDLMYYCRLWLSEPLVEKNTKRASVIEISAPTAMATLTVLTRFDKQSHVYQNFKSFLLTKIQLHLQKDQKKHWLISRAEILELDRQQVNWQDVR